MSQVKQLLDSLLLDIYGKQQQQQPWARISRSQHHKKNLKMTTQILGRAHNPEYLQQLSVRKLIDVSAILKLEIRLMGFFLERVLISRDRSKRHQEILCGFVDAILFVEFHDTHPKMRFSLSPPPPKAAAAAAVTSPTNVLHAAHSRAHNEVAIPGVGVEPPPAAVTADADDAASDYNQWLHAMKLVARLPGGMPPEFRRKLWLSLADKYLKSRNVDWTKEQEKCFCEKWREDDEELGIQIVKDLHRTGSNLCTGPAGSINQAKLKRILLGYARYNPEVGYCQGFNMLGALILQVMDKEETESMKVMIYLVEGVLPPGYFCGSMGGLQADMGVFRELMQTKLPRLAKHLQKLQGPVENAYEPPLTNVFTMQWFLTMFCTCLPMSCVLRVWDLVLIEGSDVLLRTALVLWGLLEERVLSSRTADDFYGKMGSFSSELLNGHLIDSNGLIEKVVQLGPIPDVQKLRDKHLYNIAPLRHKQGLQLYFDDEEAESDEESRLAVATVWGIPWGRRGSQSPAMNAKQVPESKDRIALDISLLKKQYDRLRERQKQAHIILTTACSTARQGASAPAAASAPSITVPVNQLLLGRPAIVLNKGRRVGAPAGAIPPARKPSLPTILHTKAPEKQLRRGETLHWRDTDLSKRRRDSLTWKEIKADRATLLREASQDVVQSSKLKTRIGKSDSSSYSEESGEEEENGSSTDTSLCDEDDPTSTGDKAHLSSLENSPRRRSKLTRKQKELSSKLLNLADSKDVAKERRRPKSWAPSTSEIPFTLMGSESPGQSGDEKASAASLRYDELLKEEEDSATESDRMACKRVKELNWSHTIAGDLATTKLAPLHVQTDILELPVITSTSQLSPMPDIAMYLNSSTISPLPTPKPVFLDSTNSLGSADGDGDAKMFDVSDYGVTNQYFERVNSVERPTKLDLFYSLNEEDSIRNAYEDNEPKSSEEPVTKSAERSQKQEFIFKPDGMSESEVYEQQKNKKNAKAKEDPVLNRRMELLLDYSEKSSAAFIAQATNELSTAFKRERLNQLKGEEKVKQLQQEHRRDNHIPGERQDDFAETWNKSQLSKEQSLSNASRKRRDPRRLTLTRSTTIDIEERFQELERRLSNDVGNQNELITVDDNLNRQKPKRIPSTADLEERYNSLEKQLSISQQVEKETHEFVENTAKRKHVLLRHADKAESTDSGVPISDISDSENVPPSKPSRERIPSTAELDSRFSALERQMSSHSLTAKNAIQLNSSQEKKDTEDKIGKKKSDENEEKDADVQKPSSDAKNATSHESNEKLTDEERPRLKKLPSTAELEDRFDALERNKSMQKSPSKTKKEPPDEMLEKLERPKKMSPNLEESKSNDKEKHTEVQSPHGNAQIKQPKEEKGETKAKDADKVNDRNQTQENQYEESNTEVIKKKPPPSTEELEKRFQALEKQMSTSVEAESEQAQKSKEEKQSSNKESRQDSADTTKIVNCSKSDEAQMEKLMQSFEDKCKQINEEIADKEIAKENEETAEQVYKPKERKENSQSKSKAFGEKCQNINEELGKKAVSTENSVKILKEKTVQESTKEQIISKRRASEPPSTEDLEKRYESLKRRMSSNTKTITERTLSKSQAVEEILEATANEETVDEDKIIKLEDTKQVKHSEEVIAEKEVQAETNKRAKSSKPPTTEDLESRYEALHQESNATTVNAISKKLNVKDNSRSEEVPTCSTKKMVKPNSNESAAKIRTESVALGVNKKELDIKKEAQVPKAPPMPKAYSQDNSLAPVDGANKQRRALIEEFESKIKTQPNDENLRPSDINPNRKSASPIPRRAIANVDDTSEAHADPAFYGRSENYESWQTKKTVRRFSDLPSRADLENRLQFLEKQLSKKFCKLRRASDSEVASRRQLASAQQVPSTSKGQGASVDLEKRVQALEKQLSDNSLKLLDAMRAKATAEAGAVSESPRKLSTETIDATGKELVRYEQFGELEEGDIHKPINISINIQMMLNKEGEKKILKTDSLRFRSAQELEERLDKLEVQLKATKSGILLSTESAEEKMDETAVNLVAEKQATLKNEKEVVELKTENETKVTEILKCANANRNEKHAAENENIDKKDSETEKNSIKSTAPKIEVVSNEEKALENQEIAEKQKIEAAKLNEDTKGAKKNVEEHAIQKANLEREVPLLEHTKEMKEKSKEIEKEIAQETETKKSKIIANAEESKNKEASSELQQQNMIINASDIGAADPNNKTLVLLLDNEPKAVKVRRLTRANTEELEGLFQALEKQLSDRNLIKSNDGKLKHADEQQPTVAQNATEECQAISDLTKKITEFTSGDQHNKSAKEVPKAEEFDWGMDPVKRHLKRKTVHLPSTKELESRFRSLERQIKLLEDVENIDVEQRLNEIERKIKLQYSLSHEKDLSKYLELCEGKGLDDEAETVVTPKAEHQSAHKSPVRNRAKSPARSKEGSPYTSPAREKIKTPYTSPTRAKERRSQHSSTQRDSKHSPHKSPRRQQQPDDGIPSTEDLEYRYRVLDLARSKSKDSLDGRSRKKTEFRKQPIHPLEMLLDPSPDDSDIPTTGELEHRMKILEQTGKTPSPTRQSRSRSPTIDDIKRQKLRDEQPPKQPIHNLETLVTSPTKRELPTAAELEARMHALEQEHCFDFKTQKNFKDFNQKLKNVVSPSLSFEEFKMAKSREPSPRRSETQRSSTPKAEVYRRSTSPKVIRFQDEDDEYSRPKSRSDQRDIERRMVGQTDGVLQMIEENSKVLQRILQKTLADSTLQSSYSGAAMAAATSEGLNAMGTRLMRETSPITRTGTHTGVPLRTDDNINERLTSIKNTIKSIDTLCEEKPYRKEKCQRYIDSLFSDSVHFAKKASLEELARSSVQREYAPSIRISDHSQRPSEFYLSRSMGSAESIRSTSPLRAASPLHHRSQRDLRRLDLSPRGRSRLEEEREEYESRVRAVNMLPNYAFHDDNLNSDLGSDLSLIKFHKVDRQLVVDDERERTSSRSASRSPLRSPYGSRETMLMHNTNTTKTTPTTTTTANSNRWEVERAAASPYRQTSHQLLGYSDGNRRSNTPVYSPTKLEIRHTTVTSTFYDRLLTEKQIEKTLSRPSSRSPLVSPSASAKSYLDITADHNTFSYKTANANSPTEPATSQPTSVLGTSALGIGNTPLTTLPNYAASSYGALTTASVLPDSCLASASKPAQYSATTPTGNSSSYRTAFISDRLPPLVTVASHTDLRIRSCDNILMQLKSTPMTTASAVGVPEQAPLTTVPTAALLPSNNATASAASVSTVGSYSSLLARPNLTTSFSYTPSPAFTPTSTFISTTNCITTSTPASLNFTTSLYSNTAIPNSVMPCSTVTIRPPDEIGNSLHLLYASTLNNNTTTGTVIHADTEGLKM